MKLIFQIGKRFLKSSRKEVNSGSLAFLGIFVATLFALVGIGILGGFQQAYRGAVFSFNGHIVLKSDVGLDDFERKEIEFELEKNKSKYPHVFTAFTYYETLMPSRSGLVPISIKGIEIQKMRSLYDFQFTGKEASGLNLFLGSGVLDSQTSAAASRLFKILKLSEKEHLQAKFENLPIQGTFTSGLYSFDAHFALADLEVLLKEIFPKGAVLGYEIRLQDPKQISDFAKFLKKKFHGLYQIQTWDQLNQSVLEALRLEKTAFFSLVVLILTIASLTLFGFTFLTFLERKNDFLLLGLLGMSQRRLRFLLLVMSTFSASLAVCLASFVAMLVLKFLRDGFGIPLDPTVYFVERVPVAFEWWWFLGAFGMALFFSVLVSFLAGRVVIKRYALASRILG